MTTYLHTASGTVYRPGDVVAGVQTHARMSAAAWAALGCEPYTPPAPTAPTAEELAAALAATPLSKLALRRALRARGLEAALDAVLGADPQAAADWADAHTVRLDDPLLAALLPAFRDAAGLTDADIAALVEEARA